MATRMEVGFSFNNRPKRKYASLTLRMLSQCVSDINVRVRTISKEFIYIFSLFSTNSNEEFCISNNTEKKLNVLISS